MTVTGDDALGVAVVRDLQALRRFVNRFSVDRARDHDAPATPANPDVQATPALPAASPAPAPFGFPIMLEVRGRRVVIAGGGHEPASKAGSLAGLGALVIVWAEHHEATAALAGRTGIELRSGPYDPSILDDALIAVVGTGDRELDHRIATDARARRVLVNTVDDIPYCDWSAPAILRRGDLTISVATAGIAPALAVKVRDRVGDLIGPEYGALLSILAVLRPRIAATGEPFASRRRLWYELVDGPALDLIRAGDPVAAQVALEAAVGAWEAAR